MSLAHPVTVFVEDSAYALDSADLGAERGIWERQSYGKGSTGRRREVDPEVRDSFRLRGKWDVAFAEKDRAKLTQLVDGAELVPQEVLLYKEGGHFAEHADRERPRRGLKHVGTVVVVGVGGYAGGKLRVHPGRSAKAGPSSWCRAVFIPLGTPHSVDAVTSGRRVALTLGAYRRAAAAIPPPKSKFKRRHSTVRMD